MFENKKQPLATHRIYYMRFFRHSVIGFCILTVCLSIGILGYHYLAQDAWIDAIHNSSMILGGMGPVAPIETNPGKLFSSAYALFCGVMLLTTVGIILAPAAHRFFHKLHLEDGKENN